MLFHSSIWHCRACPTSGSRVTIQLAAAAAVQPVRARDREQPTPEASTGRAAVSTRLSKRKQNLQQQEKQQSSAVGGSSSRGRSRRPTAWSARHAEVLKSIRDRELPLQNTRVLVAVSGGQDSMCLAQLLLDMRHLLQLEVVVAHCDHAIRSDSTANAAFVQQAAERWGVPCHVVVADADLRKEADARDWRYQQLYTLAQRTGCTAVVTGHTATDRAETVLFNISRGCGTDGLRPLRWQRPLGPGVLLVRPLLELARELTAEVCQQRGLQIYEDSTNQDTGYTRNYMRLEVLPRLQQVNAHVALHIARLVDVVDDEVSFLEASARRILNQIVTAVWGAERCMLTPEELQGASLQQLQQLRGELQQLLQQHLAQILQQAPQELPLQLRQQLEEHVAQAVAQNLGMQRQLQQADAGADDAEGIEGSLHSMHIMHSSSTLRLPLPLLLQLAAQQAASSQQQPQQAEEGQQQQLLEQSMSDWSDAVEQTSRLGGLLSLLLQHAGGDAAVDAGLLGLERNRQVSSSSLGGSGSSGLWGSIFTSMAAAGTDDMCWQPVGTVAAADGGQQQERHQAQTPFQQRQHGFWDDALHYPGVGSRLVVGGCHPAAQQQQQQQSHSGRRFGAPPAAAAGLGSKPRQRSRRKQLCELEGVSKRQLPRPADGDSKHAALEHQQLPAPASSTGFGAAAGGARQPPHSSCSIANGSRHGSIRSSSKSSSSCSSSSSRHPAGSPPGDPLISQCSSQLEPDSLTKRPPVGSAALQLLGPEFLSLPIWQLQQVPAGVLRRVVRLWLSDVLHVSASSLHVSAVLRLMQRGVQGGTATGPVVDGVVVRKRRQELVLEVV